jgi:hypothetical protein
MNLANLAMIFCSGLRIDRFMFTWLVLNWDECFRGCHTEEDEYKRINNLGAARSHSDNMSDYSLIVPPHSAPASRKPSDASSSGRMVEPLRNDAATSNTSTNHLAVRTMPSKQSLHPDNKAPSTHSRPSFDSRDRPVTPLVKHTDKSTPSPAPSPRQQHPRLEDENGKPIPLYPLTPTSTNSEEGVIREVLDREAMERRDSEATGAEMTGCKRNLTLDTEVAQKLAPCLPELEPVSPLM